MAPTETMIPTKFVDKNRLKENLEKIKSSGAYDNSENWKRGNSGDMFTPELWGSSVSMAAEGLGEIIKSPLIKSE